MGGLAPQSDQGASAEQEEARGSAGAEGAATAVREGLPGGRLELPSLRTA